MSFFEEIEYKIITNVKGDIYKIATSENCNNFTKGDFYFSEVKPKIIKTWRRHKILNSIIGVVSGEIEVKLRSEINEPSITKNLFLKNSKMIKIKPGTWYSFENKKNITCMLFVILDGEHNDSEVERL